MLYTASVEHERLQKRFDQRQCRQDQLKVKSLVGHKLSVCNNVAIPTSSKNAIDSHISAVLTSSESSMSSNIVEDNSSTSLNSSISHVIPHHSNMTGVELITRIPTIPQCIRGKLSGNVSMPVSRLLMNKYHNFL